MPVCTVNATRTARNVLRQIFARNVSQDSGNSSSFSLMRWISLNSTGLYEGRISLAYSVTVELSMDKVREPHRTLTRKEYVGMILRSWWKLLVETLAIQHWTFRCWNTLSREYFRFPICAQREQSEQRVERGGKKKKSEGKRKQVTTHGASLMYSSCALWTILNQCLRSDFSESAVKVFHPHVWTLSLALFNFSDLFRLLQV